MWNDKLVELQRLVAPAVGAYQAHEAARAGEVEAKRHLLEQLVDMLRPVLPALAGDVQVGLVRVVGEAAGAIEDRADIASEGGERLRALHVAGDRVARQDTSSARSGNYVGRGVVMLPDGRLAELTYEGTWKKASPETSPGEELARWRATVRMVDAAHVARSWKADDFLAGLHKALVAHNTHRVKQAQATEARGARVAALTTLLEQMRILLQEKD